MTAAMGVVIPAHNEEELVDRCLDAVLRSANHPLLRHVPVRIIAVLDNCSDRTGDGIERASRHLPQHRDIDLLAVEVSHTNVGLARAAGCAVALDSLAGVDMEQAWLAMTDADSVVPVDWLAHQLRLHRAGVHAWAGTVEVTDWRQHPVEVARRFSQLYRSEHGPRGHHRHVHGANLGVSARAYRSSGGFSATACGEDHALLAAVHLDGWRTSATAAMPVLTSARRDPRAAGGFGDTLRRLSLGRGHRDHLGGPDASSLLARAG